MEVLEKIAALIFQAAGSTYSWAAIFASYTFASILFYLHHVHGTIFLMNETILNVATWMFLISLFLMLHKTFSAIGEIITSVRSQKKAEIQHAIDKKRFTQILLALSAKELGLLKFILHQDFQAAWLIPQYTIVIILTSKGCLKQIDYLEDKRVSIGNDQSLASLFTVPETIKEILLDMPPELAARWRKTRINNSFAKYQH